MVPTTLRCALAGDPLAATVCEHRNACGAFKRYRERPFADIHPPHPCAGSSRIVFPKTPKLLKTLKTPIEAVTFLSGARVRDSVTPNNCVPLPKTYGQMVCQHFNTGNGTHSKAPIPDSAEKPGQGRGICGGTMPLTDVGSCRSRSATIGDASGVAVRHKPGAATLFRTISK